MPDAEGIRLEGVEIMLGNGRYPVVEQKGSISVGHSDPSKYSPEAGE